ncbi:MAG: hypothetical protein V4751_13905 [Pseudomonadota bacterium]
MEKWLIEVRHSLDDAITKATGGSIPLQNLYMLAPIMYSEAHKMRNEKLLQEMIEASDDQVAADVSLDAKSKEQYKFHFVSSYLFCFVLAGKIEEMQYDRIMDYVCERLDLFEDDYGHE